MLTYLANAACNGKRPGHLSSLRNYPRTSLVMKLMGERNVARFIVAPSGYGKTSVALEYAETVFGFRNVFWISGKSPCFIRDLDKGFVSSELVGLNKNPFLVVIDDVPLLDVARAASLSAQIDELLEAGKEVIVACEPTSDAFSQMTDRVLVGARDLIVSASELAQTGRAPKPTLDDAAPTPARQDCVAGLVWGEGVTRSSFLRAVVDEELPSEMILAMFVLVVLASGSLDDAEKFVVLDADLLRLLDESYPHLGIDMIEGTFRTAPFSIDDLVGAFLERLGALAQRSTAADGDDLACGLADELVARGACARACDLVRTFVSRQRRAAWLGRHGAELIDSCCLVEASSVYGKLDAPRASGLVHAGEALRCALLKADVACCQAARRCLRDDDVVFRLAGALLLAAVSQASAGVAARKQLASFVAEAQGALGKSRAGNGSDGAPAHRQGDEAAEAAEGSRWLDLADLLAAADVLLSADETPAAGARAWLAGFGDSGAGRRLGPVALLCAAWLIESHRGARKRGGKGPSTPAGSAAGRRPKRDALGKLCERVVSAARACMDDEGALDLTDALAISAIASAARRGEISLPKLDEALVGEASARLELLEKQRLDRQCARRRDFETRLATSQARAAARRPPILTVNLYGGLAVSVGDKQIDPELFARQKDRVLLALLVLNKGRDLSRDKLAEMLFPESELAAGRKGLQSTWCRLKDAIKLPDESCPYLIRRYKSLSIDASLVSSDVLELDEVCRTLLFNQPGQGGWSQLVKRVEDVFAGDILPGDSDVRALDRLRMDMRKDLVDALVAASLSLVRSGQPQQALWFAQAALRRDDTREDVYAALMRAQIAALQRSAALRTYFDCRKMLAEGLGIDPAKEIVQLYNSIIETEGAIA